MSRRASTFLLVGCLTAILAAPTTPADVTPDPTNPFYTSAGIVHAASQVSGTLAPNMIGTIYGTNLSWVAQNPAGNSGGVYSLPTSIGGVQVVVNGLLCGLFFVSPGQINFLMPYEITGPTATVFVNRQNIIGPKLTLPLATGVPAFFQWNGNFAVAQHADGSLLSPSAPAHGGEVIVLYATGLGRTTPDLQSDSASPRAASILYLSQLQVFVDGSLCPPSSIYYAGVTPGYAGLYQINLKLPATLGANPKIQVTMGQQASPASVQIFAQ